MDKVKCRGKSGEGKGDESMKADGLGCLRIQTQSQPYMAFEKKIF